MISSKIENANCNYFVNLVIINECNKHLRAARFEIKAKTILFIFIHSVFKFSIHDISLKLLNNIFTLASYHARVFLNNFY